MTETFGSPASASGSRSLPPVYGVALSPGQTVLPAELIERTSRATGHWRIAEESTRVPFRADELTAVIESLSEASPWLNPDGELSGAPAGQELIERHPWPDFVDEPALYLAQLLSAVELLNKTYGQSLVGNVASLSLRVSTLRAINHVIQQESPRAGHDATLAAVIQMTLHEYKFGDRETYAMHMQGLRNMIAVRQGLDTISDLMLKQAAWFALSIEATQAAHSGQCEREFQHAVTVHSALLAFTGGNNDLGYRLKWLLYLTARHSMGTNAPSNTPQRPGEESNLEDPLNLLQELEGYGSLARPPEVLSEAGDGSGERQYMLGLVAECTRLALSATLARIVRTSRRAHQPPAATARLADEAQEAMRSVQLRQLETQRLLGTQYAFVFAWAHFAVNGPSSAEGVHEA